MRYENYNSLSLSLSHSLSPSPSLSLFEIAMSRAPLVTPIFE